jgi:hypothetical protein
MSYRYYAAESDDNDEGGDEDKIAIMLRTLKKPL